ncbi:hypothetical protein [uncultured Vagococcus sp.]|uniref:hypothetical protein n=1 Tax=uncultured Vagococcus sp. TaxID=189676 RepID=UPI0028D78AFC|nr:hypothetical protein [uncultured Vagococcus sp.]
MKFIKCLRYDFLYGILKNGWLWLCPIMLGGAVFFDGLNRINKIYLFQQPKSPVTFGDIWFYAYGGMKPYHPSPENAFQFPVIWLVLYLSIAFILLNYPLRDFEGGGLQRLIRFQARYRWWVSKCAWNISCTMVLHLVFVCVLVILSIGQGIPITREIHLDLIKLLFELDIRTELIQRFTIPVSILLAPLLLSIFLNLFQMLLSLFVKPVFSFFTITSVLLSSTYLLDTAAIGNYGMVLRYSWVLPMGVSYPVGMVVSMIFIVLSVITGWIRCHFFDILSKE